MPPGNNYLDLFAPPIKVLCYGDAKTKKTLWTMKAAELGYRVIIFDADKGAKIIKLIPKQFRDNIFIVDMSDSATYPIALNMMKQILKEQIFFEEQTKRRLPPLEEPDPKYSYYEINLRRLSTDTICVFDSLSAIIDSMRWHFANENSIDLTDAKKDERVGFMYMAMMTNWMINVIKNLPCHCIVISHKQFYEKRRTEEYEHQGIKKKKEIIEFVRTQPTSSSGPQGGLLAKQFDDVLLFRRTSSSASGYIIDTAGDDNKDAGSRTIAPNQYKWDQLTLGELLRQNGHPYPLKRDKGIPFSKGIKWHPPGESFAIGIAKPKGQIAAPKDKIVEVGGSKNLANLLS